MKLFKYMKDGGPESKVAGFFFVEIKSLLSVVLLHFFDGSRDAFHDHAFDAISWVLKGKLAEHSLVYVSGLCSVNEHTPSLLPIWTPRTMMHKVISLGDTWVLSFRGPWVDLWHEYLPKLNKRITLTHGRKEIEQ